MRIQIKLVNQPNNMGNIQEFDDAEHLEQWLNEHGSTGTNLLPEHKLDLKAGTLIFGIPDADGDQNGSGKITMVADEEEN